MGCTPKIAVVAAASFQSEKIKMRSPVLHVTKVERKRKVIRLHLQMLAVASFSPLEEGEERR